MRHPNGPFTRKRRKCGFRKDVGLELVDWVRTIVQSNQELVSVLERLRCSYTLLLAGTSITDAEEILWQVDGALLNVKRSTVRGSNIRGVGPTRQ
jgi:hypothetical protein